MMTGFALEDLVREALDEGASAVVYKPFEIEKVLGIVESYMNQRNGHPVNDGAQAGAA
jgi:AmiR/NasT family two-component response regulator